MTWFHNFAYSLNSDTGDSDVIMSTILTAVMLEVFGVLYTTGWPKKVSHYQMTKKSYLITLKPANEI